MLNLVIDIVIAFASILEESACNAGDPGSIPWSGRSTGEGIGYPFQYSWTSLVAQIVKNLPAGESPWTEESDGLYLWGHKESDMTEQLSIGQHI